MRTTINNPSTLPARWLACMQKNNILAWHALSTWLAAEALMASIDGDMDMCYDLWMLADVANQHKLDLQPSREERIMGVA